MSPRRAGPPVPLLLAALPILAGGAGCATAPPYTPAAPLESRVEAVLSAPPLDGIHWGILVVDAGDGRVLYERSPHLRFVPASNMKIPVTVAALGLLGPDHRWETALYAPAEALPRPPAPGTVGRGILEGDLYLAATGDPTLGEPFRDRPDQALRELADSLRAAGIREVDGDLVVDVSAWDSTTVPGSWMVGSLSPRFGATGGAFVVGAGELEIELVGGTEPGEPARLEWWPRGPGSFVENRVVTAPHDSLRRVEARFLPESRRWVLEGELPPSDTLTLTRASRDPVRLSVDVLARVLEEEEIRIGGEVRIVWARDRPLADGCRSGDLPACSALVRVAGLRSPPLTEVVRAILEPSQNWMTEQLVRTLGAAKGEEGSWPEGLGIVTRYLIEDVGVDPLDVHLRDGSGLSAYNLLTPRALVATLAHARGRPWGLSFQAAMPQPGRMDSTLERRLEGLEGRVFAKTGTISHVNALSGFLVTDDGRELVFSILTNTSNLPANQVREGIDRVVRELVRSPPPARPR
jgi:serine-type D-Ala-D-Ala carboxypeptidase/endopeptidase (penicillin-binding protein 4)